MAGSVNHLISSIRIYWQTFNSQEKIALGVLVIKVIQTVQFSNARHLFSSFNNFKTVMLELINKIYILIFLVLLLEICSL